jgi:hypothetical protein
VAARIMAGRPPSSVASFALEDQGLEDTAEHFGINGNLIVIRRILVDGEIVRFEQTLENVVEYLVAQRQAPVPF